MSDINPVGLDKPMQDPEDETMDPELETPEEEVAEEGTEKKKKKDKKKDKEIRVINTLLEKQVDGLLFMGGTVTDEHVSAFHTANVPMYINIPTPINCNRISV